MKAASLWQISISTSAEAEEAVAALLERLFGEPASTYVDERTHEPLVTVYSKQSPGARREALLAGLKYIQSCGLDPVPAKIAAQRVRREDWTKSWRKYFKTIEIGSALLIKPSWSKRRARRNQAVIILDPGLSFGTGQHATTAFCLRQIVACRRPEEDQSLLDIGSGSGILAIAAAKLHYRPVEAYDNDPVAVRVAKVNATRNRVQDRVAIARRDLRRQPLASKRRFDVVCANLTDNLLIERSNRIVNRLKPGGRLILAGILASQFPAVQKAYEKLHLKLLLTQIEGDWQSGAFAR